MFSQIKTTSAQRITEVREFLDFFTPSIPLPPNATPRHLNTCKGLVFVQLYGTIEYTISATIAKTIDIINQEAVKIQDLKYFLWGMALNSQFDALIQTNKKKWDKRIELFVEVNANNDANISNDIVPTNGENFTYPQLQSIWSTFAITEPVFNDVTFRGRLQEIVSYRCNIAHGNYSSADIGVRVTPADLYQRLNEVSNYCSYFISVFEEYTKQGDFIR